MRGGATPCRQRRQAADGLAAGVREAAERQLRDYDAGTPNTLFRTADAPGDRGWAYAVQAEVARRRVARGERVIGYKVGLAAPALRAQLGIEGPVFGRLFDSERASSPARLALSKFTGLAVEGELAVRLAGALADLPGTALDDDAILAAVESAFVVIELHNAVFRLGRPNLVELIAGNAMHAGFVAALPRRNGAELRSALDDDRPELTIAIDSKPVATVAAADLAHTVASSLRWLAAELAAAPDGAAPPGKGQTVLCGAVAPLFPVAGPCRIEASSGRFGTALCRIE